MHPTTLAAIVSANDLLRTTFLNGRVLITDGIRSLPEDLQSRIIEAIQTFDDFGPENDPFGEHDFGVVTVDGRKAFWKIDYYAPDMLHGSEDPSNAEETRLVLTIMLADEY